MQQRKRIQTTFEGAVSMTQQAFRSQTNIQEIINRSKLRGRLPEATSKGFFGDFAGIDFQSMQNLVASAQQGFDLLHPAIRRRFHNDPAELISFIDDDENRPEAIKLGLIQDRGTVPPLDVTVPTDTKVSETSSQ